MKYSEAVSYLYSLGNETLAMKLGLETISKLAGACGDPQRKFPAVHIAGTNGKGSTAAMIDSILRAANFRIGLYTSPHLVSITERVRVDGDEIKEDDFARLATVVRAVSEKLVAEGELEAPPTYFEQVTMIGFLYFAEREVEMAVLEVGMGGRLDATNICIPVVTAITPIGFDHQQHLGTTLGEIAGEKAGIVKAGIPVVVAEQDEEAHRAIVERCRELDAPIIKCGMRNTECGMIADPIEFSSIEDAGIYRLRYRGYDLRLGLRGRHQVGNAVTAIHLAEQIEIRGFEITTEAIVEGLNRVEWPGRLELIRFSKTSALLLMDGAHNAAGAAVLRDFLSDRFSSIPITIIFGAMSDKSIEEMAAILFPLANKIIATRVNNPRAVETGRIAEIAGEYCSAVIRVESAGDALAEASRITPSDGLICVCGSLFLVGEIKHSIRC